MRQFRSPSYCFETPLMEDDTTTGAEQPPPPEQSAISLKSLAEEKYSASDFKAALKLAKKAHRLDPTLDGLRQMITALRILRASPFDPYRILDIEPFSHINSIKKKYKSLALLLHPDKSSSSSAPFFLGSVEAFKRVGEAFRVLSDRDRRKEYDGKLRVQIEAAEVKRGEDGAVETFWTACNTCRLFHEFDRRYLGQRLLCPSCRKSFLAIEVNAEDGDAAAAVDARGDGFVISKFSTGKRSSRSRSKSSVDNMKSPATAKNSLLNSLKMGLISKKRKRELTLKEMQAACLSKAGRVENKKREPTLKEMQEEALRMKPKSKLVKVKGEALENTRSKRRETNVRFMELSDDGDGSLNVMTVEDSDFYDFDKDRTEKSFRKGEVWAIYDDDDGMPRHYGLIEEVLSRNPFELKMSWLDLQSNGEESIMLWEKMGFHVSCGRFKLGKKVNVDSVNLFSHVVCCERAAKEVYRIFPRKGSVWALYSERTISGGEERCYDIIVVLTSFSELYGLSLGYLEKVVGFKTIFQRREIGVHAIRCLEKDHLQLFSHQIPSRKLVGEEGLNLPNECWELDPASLPADLLGTTGGE